MLDKYFGFLRINDEYSVLDSLIEHIRIDDQEFILLSKMIQKVISKETAEVELFYNKLIKINEESKRIFENEAEQIIQANFDNQKQYDYLRTFQRIENISSLIITTAQKIIILEKINGFIPENCNQSFSNYLKNIAQMHEYFQDALVQYQKNKKNIIPLINKIEEINKTNKNEWSQCLLNIFALANEGSLPLGTSQCLEALCNQMQSMSNAIHEAAASMEWLLIY